MRGRVESGGGEGYERVWAEQKNDPCDNPLSTNLVIGETACKTHCCCYIYVYEKCKSHIRSKYSVELQN